ncbi:helix-turn-helix domain-containing protein [Rhodoglobus vestalii]|uniref:helix-turn-helix domain-containing protein n=1 Tax=Rhodoglobus vestalii TaxID=193384 RepID=UPI001FEA586F|nr:helix-turn-helix transcriptional regulator [Rhodoglobus vestalii]
MVQRASSQQKRLLRDFGANIRRWRKVNGMSAVQVAERAFITRQTLRNIENGTGTARMDSLFAVLMILGVDGTVVDAADPYNNNAGRSRIDDILSAGGTI